MDLDSRHLRAFVAVVEEGTFTDAAIELGVSQASVTRSVQRLEQDLGTRLLARTTREVARTSAGDRAYVRAKRILAEVDLLAADAAHDLRIGYAWAALGARTTAVQRAWSRRYAAELVFVQVHDVVDALARGRCQLAIVRGPVASSGLDAVLVGSEPRYAVLAADHVLAGQDSLALADLAGLVVAVDAETGTTRPELWPQGEGPAEFRATHGIDDWLTEIATGAVVGVTPEATTQMYGRPAVAYRRLRDAPEVPVWLVWRSQDRPVETDALAQLCRASVTA